jgi:putative PIG3 family NAD(P)H quinone oxidoreductase
MWGVIASEGALIRVERPDEQPGPGQVRIRAAAAGVNRADLAQRAGTYPPPPGTTDVLGLECAGTLDAVGPGVGGWRVGDRVAALLTGGGYASAVVCPAGVLFPIPDELSFAEAAALPEALVTVRTCLDAGPLRRGDAAVWHAGASGIGTTGVQICRELGVRTFVTVGSADKVVRCRALGADDGWVRDPGGFVSAARAWTPAGAALVVDPVGGAYLAWDQEVLAPDGTIVVLAFLAGRAANVDLGRLLVRRQRIVGTTLRARSDTEKAQLVDRVRTEWWPWVAAGRIGPVVDATFPMSEVDAAHARLAAGGTVGKLVLTL